MNTSRKLLLAGAVAAAGLALGTTAMAQTTPGNTATAHVNASASVVTPVSITPGNDLKFGRFVLDNGASSASVTVSSDGTTVTNTNVTQLTSGTNAGTQAGSFTATGENSASVTITLGQTGFGNGATLSALEHNAGASPAFDSSGNLAFNVGGKLTVTSAVHGNLSGTVTATVAYP